MINDGGLTIDPGQTVEVPMREMSLAEIRSAVECDIFGAGPEWQQRVRAMYGWEPISCQEALALEKGAKT